MSMIPSRAIVERASVFVVCTTQLVLSVKPVEPVSTVMPSVRINAFHVIVESVVWPIKSATLEPALVCAKNISKTRKPVVVVLNASTVIGVWVADSVRTVNVIPMEVNRPCAINSPVNAVVNPTEVDFDAINVRREPTAIRMPVNRVNVPTMERSARNAILKQVNARVNQVSPVNCVIDVHEPSTASFLIAARVVRVSPIGIRSSTASLVKFKSRFNV